MQLDRYNESVAASASSANQDIPNKPIKASQLLDKIMGGEVQQWGAYKPMASDMYKTGKADQYDVYKENAVRTWNFIQELAK
jgi:hypothetical protein